MGYIIKVMRCDKYKKKASIGALLFLIYNFLRVFELYNYIDFFLFVMITTIIGIIALVLIVPYIRCLQRCNKPFDKIQ